MWRHAFGARPLSRRGVAARAGAALVVMAMLWWIVALCPCRAAEAPATDFTDHPDGGCSHSGSAIPSGARTIIGRVPGQCCAAMMTRAPAQMKSTVVSVPAPEVRGSIAAADVVSVPLASTTPSLAASPPRTLVLRI